MDLQIHRPVYVLVAIIDKGVVLNLEILFFHLESFQLLNLAFTSFDQNFLDLPDPNKTNALSCHQLQ